MQEQNARIVIKIGTNVLTTEDGFLDTTTIARIAKEIALLKREGKRIVLISSGAMGAGRAIVGEKGNASLVVQRQLLAAVGQVELMRAYVEAFRRFDMVCAQVLATKEDFRDRTHYLNMRSCFDALLDERIIPIVNENDVVSVSELMFTDNDELAVLVAAMVDADRLIILTSVDGLYDRAPDEKGATVIPRILQNDTEWKAGIRTGTSSFGRGGMATKAAMAQRAAHMGIDVCIANGKKSGVLASAVRGDEVGTTFVAARRISNIKKRIATIGAQTAIGIVINQGALDRLQSHDAAVSILPVGIVRIKGDFEKGDIISVLDSKGNAVGYGLAQYGSAIAREYMGLKGKKALIHYDYFFHVV